MSLLDFLFPRKCINCRKFGGFLCPDCFSQLKYAEYYAGSQGSLDAVISVVAYNSIARELIRQLKYRPYLSGLGEIVSDIMNEGLAQDENFYRFIKQYRPAVIPIPLSAKRLRERGYNHAEILANYVAKYFGLKLEPGILIRAKDTKPQYKLKREARIKNVKDAFIIRQNPNSPNIPKAAILVDDLATTLATLNEAARVLKSAGVRRVMGVTFAREL
jgi:ComF family protein